MKVEAWNSAPVFWWVTFCESPTSKVQTAEIFISAFRNSGLSLENHSNFTNPSKDCKSLQLSVLNSLYEIIHTAYFFKAEVYGYSHHIFRTLWNIRKCYCFSRILKTVFSWFLSLATHLFYSSSWSSCYCYSLDLLLLFFCIFAYLFIYALNESISYTKLVNSFFFLVYWHSSISHNRIVPLLKNESKMCVWASLLFWILDGHCHLLLGIFIGTSHRTLCCAVLSCSVMSDS